MYIEFQVVQEALQTFWLTGLSDTGKTTQAKTLPAQPRKHTHPVRVIDRGSLRKDFSSDLDFFVPNSEEQCRRVPKFAKLLNQNRIIASGALISPTPSEREQARQIIGHDWMREICVSTPCAIGQQRDVKGLYAKVQRHPSLQMTGIRMP